MSIATQPVVDPNLIALEQEGRWIDAITQLEDMYYLWYSYAIRMELKACRGWCQTAAVDGKHLFFNPEWSATLSDQKLLFVLIHEVFHIAAGHLWRGAPYIKAAPRHQQAKVARRVNRAQDGAIHQILVPLALNEQAGIIEFPPEGIYDPAWDNLSFEEIYQLMLQELEEEKGPPSAGPPSAGPPSANGMPGESGDGSGNEPGDGQGSGNQVGSKGSGELLDVHVHVGDGGSDSMPEGATDLGDGNWVLVTDASGNPIKPDPSDTENPFPGVTKEDLQKLASEAVSEARDVATGNLSGSGNGTGAGRGMGSQLRVAEVGESKVDWKQILRQWVLMTAKSDYRFTRPNRRYLARGMMVPGLVSESITGVIAVDVSGSIDRKTYSSFMTELEQIRKELPEHDLHVIWCSDGIHKTQQVNQHETIDRDFNGTGGTSFKPVFDYVEKNVPNPMFLIYFTDGENSDREKTKQPHYPVLWALNGTHVDEYPWGINMRIDKN